MKKILLVLAIIAVGVSGWFLFRPPMKFYNQLLLSLDTVKHDVIFHYDFSNLSNSKWDKVVIIEGPSSSPLWHNRYQPKEQIDIQDNEICFLFIKNEQVIDYEIDKIETTSKAYRPIEFESPEYKNCFQIMPKTFSGTTVFHLFRCDTTLTQ